MTSPSKESLERARDIMDGVIECVNCREIKEGSLEDTQLAHFLKVLATELDKQTKLIEALRREAEAAWKLREEDCIGVYETHDQALLTNYEAAHAERVEIEGKL